MNSRLCSILLLLAAACRPPTGPGGLVRPGTPPQVDIVRARERGLAQSFTWEEWGPEAFARAKREGRYLLIDGAAEWCHWCHVMDETTYRDPEVGRLLRERFVTIRVDVDARPDLAERWSDYGWPATILLSPDAEEVGKYRGYLPPDRFLTLLWRVEVLALLAQRTGEARYREAALSVGERLLRDFAAPEGGALFESTPDSDAVGIFARRERPFVQNVGAARFLAALHALTGERTWRDRGREVLAGISTARSIASQGRFVGEYLLAADELGVIPWPPMAPKPEGSTGTPQAGLPVPSTH